MKKNNRDQYLKAWLTYLKGKNRIDPKALADFLGKTLKGALAPITRKRYTATVIINLYENGFLAGKTGKTFSGEPLEIVQEITLDVLDRCLTSNYKKIKFTETGQVPEPVELVAEPPAAKKPKKTVKKKKAEKPEVVAEAPAAKKARKATPKKKPVPKAAQAKKPVARKPGPAKKITPEPPEMAEVVKARKAPVRKPRKKAAAKVPVVARKKRGPKGTGLIGRKTDLLRMGEGAFLYSLELTQRVEDLERENAAYRRAFEAIRGLFGREIDEIEEWLGVVLE
jgi:hypothetical protein